MTYIFEAHELGEEPLQAMTMVTIMTTTTTKDMTTPIPIGTEGGSERNTQKCVHIVPRMLPETLAAEIEFGSWDLLPVFQWLKTSGQVAPAEMCRTFNVGIGMVIAVEASKADAVIQVLSSSEKVYRIGHLLAREHGQPGTHIRNLDTWL